MEKKEFDELRRGDIVCHIGTGLSYVIERPIEDYYLGIRSIAISNPSEWIKYASPK